MTDSGGDPVIIELCQLKPSEALSKFFVRHISVLAVSNESVPVPFVIEFVHVQFMCIDKPGDFGEPDLRFRYSSERRAYCSVKKPLQYRSHSLHFSVVLLDANQSLVTPASDR
jgi:hypothetical protein